jgi:putative peptidoglycan lipid II flippase
LVKIVTDGFYALQDLRAPVVVSLSSMAANAGLNGLFIFTFGMDHRGLALATSCTMTLSFAWLWILLRRRSGLEHLDGRSAAIMLGKMIVVSALVGGVAAASSHGVDLWLGHEAFLARLFQVGFSVCAALVVFYTTCKLMRVREMDQALRAIMPAGPVVGDWR